MCGEVNVIREYDLKMIGRISVCNGVTYSGSLSMIEMIIYFRVRGGVIDSGCLSTTQRISVWRCEVISISMRETLDRLSVSGGIRPAVKCGLQTQFGSDSEC